MFLTAIFSLSLMASTSHKAPHHKWDYKGEFAPEHWGDFYPTCKTGKFQTPIDIKTSETTKLDETHDSLKFFNYFTNVNIDVVNNGHTIKVVPLFNRDHEHSYITVDGKSYELLQFHIHTHSENTINGERFDLVAHLVHKSYDGELAVIAVFFKIGEEDNHELYKYWDNMPKEAHTYQQQEHVDIHSILPDNLDEYYAFMGSLTTPPCTEGVKWFVMKEIKHISKEQVELFRKIYPHNYRPIQPTNSRVIYER